MDAVRVITNIDFVRCKDESIDYRICNRMDFADCIHAVVRICRRQEQ